MTADEYRRKAERYLAYARRMQSREARTAIIDRAAECARLAEIKEPDKRVAE